MSEYPYGVPSPDGQKPQQPQEPSQTQARPTASTPPVPGAAHAAGDAGPQPQPAHEARGPERKPRRTLGAVVAGLLGGVVGAGALTAALLGAGVVGAPSQTLLGGGVQQVTISPNDEDVTTANAVAAKALPSVVTVYCTFADGSGMGSGVVYDRDGNIITNNHVIEDAESVSVTLNGQSYPAEVVGTDASSDLAVIKADFGGADVVPIEVGDSSELAVGDWVMSVGSPFGLESSVSQGIVSALSRNTLMEGASGNTLYTNLIQTDATINPGNSGGALVDAEGRLVGICTLYSSDTQSFAGIGYAIPSDYATEIADKIISGETATHAYIGLTMQTVTAQNARRQGLSVDQGAYVVEVAEDGPAARAGIEAGDVLVGIDGTQVTSADGAILAVRSHSIDETVRVTVMRGDRELSFDVTLGSDEALQQEQERGDETVNINGREVTLDDLIDLYEQYHEQRYSPFGGR